MYENEFGNLLYELFNRHNPAIRLAQDFDSVYIFMNGDLYTYYDKWKVIGHRIIPTSEDVSPILDEVRDVTREFIPVYFYR
jgi:hypothetical protein